MTRSTVLRTLPVLTLAVWVVSCASTQQSMVHSKATYDEVWKACIDSLFDVNFSASSADSKTGLIVADQAVIGGHGTVVRLNIMVSRSADGTDVSVNFVPPPGTVGGGGIVDDYAKALKKRIPDIDVTKVK